MKSLVDALESEVYSNVDAYKAENFDDPIPYPLPDYDEVFEDDDD